MGIVRDSFVMLKDWIEGIESLPTYKEQLEAYKAVSRFGLTGEIPENLSKSVKPLLIMLKGGMERNMARYRASVENGKLGGAPKGNQNAKKLSTMEEEKQPKTTQINLEQPKTTKNNLNVNDLLFVNYININKRDKLASVFVDKFRDYIDNYCNTQELKEQTEFILMTLATMQQFAIEQNGLKFNGKQYSVIKLADALVRLGNEDLTRINNALLLNKDDIKDLDKYIIGTFLNMVGESYVKKT